FAADVQRYLNDEAVEACPPTTGYRLQKFVRRNRGPVLAAALIMLALVGGVIGTTWGLMRAEQARQAEAKRADGERLANETEQKRLVQIEKAVAIVGSVFKDLDPRSEEKEGKPLRALLGDRLDRAAKELQGDAVGDPLTVAKLQMRLGESQRGLGYPEKAI